MDLYDLGPDFSGGPEGPDRSLLAHCLNLLDTLGGDPVVAVEFGVGSGETTRMIAEYMPVIGFDSFAGLPEDWRPGFPAGKFSHFEPPTDIVGATIVPGWFEHTVTGYDWSGYDIALIHMDADLYSSTKTCLESIGDWIAPGCVVVFDEFHGFDDDLSGEVPGEQRAWREFAEPWLEWEVIGHGREQWAIRITGATR